MCRRRALAPECVGAVWCLQVCRADGGTDTAICRLHFLCPSQPLIPEQRRHPRKGSSKLPGMVWLCGNCASFYQHGKSHYDFRGVSPASSLGCVASRKVVKRILQLQISALAVSRGPCRNTRGSAAGSPARRMMLMLLQKDSPQVAARAPAPAYEANLNATAS